MKATATRLFCLERSSQKLCRDQLRMSRDGKMQHVTFQEVKQS
jgi:hypothetical protein